ncbi:MAG: glycosyltransferase family 9 protein [Terrimicrobiaceae bacterium]
MKQAKKILVLQLKRIGDLILTTPALALLKEQFPEAEITLLTEKSCAGILPVISGVRGFARGQEGFWKAAMTGYDVCLDFTGTDRSALLTVLSRAKMRATFARFQKKFPHRLAYTQFLDSSVRKRHTADHYTDLLGVLGIPRENEPLHLSLPPTIVQTAKGLTPNSTYAVIHAGTARPEKYWLPERWAEVATFLAKDHGLQILLTGSTDPSELSHLAAIRDAITKDITVLDLSGKTGLPEVAAVIQGASIFCGVDTAAMHLADAVLTPTVALFGPTNPFHWRPRHTRSVVVRSRTAEPFTPEQKGGEMTEISTERVIAAASDLLGSPRSSKGSQQPGGV